MPAPPITATDLVKRYDDVAVVDGVTLQVDAGTIQGFVGPSGSGKTTTVRLLAGVLTPTSGATTVLGSDPRDLGTDERRRIGYMPQLGVLYPHLTVTQNLRFVASLYGLRRPGGRIAELLEVLDLGAARRRALRDCSGGMQRRVALAAALLHDPDLLFLDEPTSGLDPVLRQRLWERFGELRDEGRTLFVTTQIVSEAAMCDRVGLIADGRLLADDSPTALRRRASGGDEVDIRTEAPIAPSTVDELAQHDLVHRIQRIGTDGRAVRVVVADADADVEALTSWLRDRSTPVSLTERHLPTFDEVFVALLEGER